MSRVSLDDAITWKWTKNTDCNYVNITLMTKDQRAFKGTTHIQLNHIDFDNAREAAFTEKDAFLYNEFKKSIGDFNYSEQDKLLMAIDATCLARFHKKLTVVDNYFKPVNKARKAIVGEVVSIVTVNQNSSNKCVSGNFLVVEKDDESQTCYLMLLNKELQVGKGQYWKYSTLVKVGYDKIIPMSVINTELIKTLNIA